LEGKGPALNPTPKPTLIPPPLSAYFPHFYTSSQWGKPANVVVDISDILLITALLITPHQVVKEDLFENNHAF
jgi:hypothetical protein